MRKIFPLSLMVLAFCFSFLQIAKAQENPATVIFFHSVTCPKCIIVEKYLLAEAKAGHLVLLEFENSSFPNLRAEFDTAFGVAPAAKNSIPIVFVGRQYLCDPAIKSELATVLTALTEEDSDYPLTFLAKAEAPLPLPLEQANIPSKNKLQKQNLAYLILLSLAILALPFFSQKRKSQ